jgi:hypothetical protein
MRRACIADPENIADAAIDKRSNVTVFLHPKCDDLQNARNKK